jgi:hypothetical protein
MASLTAAQQSTRARVETLIRLMAPGLDLLLAVGERIARIAEPDDSDYLPPRRLTADRQPPAVTRGAD